MINTNITAISAQATLSRIQNDMAVSMQRLASGKRINAASDDAAGMAISEKMTAQIKGLGQAIRNATDGKNLVDTTEGAHVEVSNMLQRLRELAVQSANDTNTASDRSNLASEGRQLITEINRVAQGTTFNGMKILDGSFTGKQLQIGADSSQVMTIEVDSAAATDIGAYKVQTNASLADGVATDTGIAAGTVLDITGYAGSGSITTSAGQSAKSLAEAVNGMSAGTGVEATAITKMTVGGFTAATSVTFELNGISIGNVNISDTQDLRGLRDAINSKSGQTGVMAKQMDGLGHILVLTDNDGDDIALTGFDTGVDGTFASAVVLNADESQAGAVFGSHYTLLHDLGGGDRAYVTGQVEMTSTKSFSVAADNTTVGASFLETATSSANLESVSEIDLTTATGASSAIKVIDVALQKINQSRSQLGAVSNRLDATISNLSNISVNVQAARSGILDTDYAKEMSALARGKILAQAATAMLAQANASQQNIMQLLRG